MRAPLRRSRGAFTPVRQPIHSSMLTTPHAAITPHFENPDCVRKSQASLSCGPPGKSAAATVQPTNSIAAKAPVTSNASPAFAQAIPANKRSSVVEPASAIQLASAALNVPVSRTCGTRLNTTNSRTWPPHKRPAAACPISWTAKQRKESRIAYTKPRNRTFRILSYFCQIERELSATRPPPATARSTPAPLHPRRQRLHRRQKPDKGKPPEQGREIPQLSRPHAR